MALGTVKASGGLQTQLVSDRSSDITSQAASGLGDAVNRLAQAGLGYLNSRTDIERVYDDRALKSKALELDTQFLQYQQDRGKEFTEYSRGRSASPGGMTKDYDARLAEQEKAFLATVPPRHKEEMAAKLARDRATRVGSAFAAELELLDTADTTTLNKGLNTLGSGLKAGTVSLEDAEATWEETVLKSGLPDVTKKEFVESGKITLQGLEFGTQIKQTALGYGAVADGTDGSDVVAAGLLPQERGVLNAIAANESPSYNVWNGGSTFEGYEDHPAATSAAPGESTAAGRYQFLLGTWRAASASYEQATGVKVPNFSPEWQDRVALHWAEKQFNAHHSGATFREILANGDPQQILTIRDVLGKPRSANPNDLEWRGLGHMSDAQFIEIITGQKGFAGGGTGAASGPNVWTDPRFANLPLDQKQSFANAAAAAAEQQKAAMASSMQLERDRFLSQAYNAGYQGDPAIVDALKSSVYWDAEAQAKFNAGQEVFRKAETETTQVSQKLAAGTPLASGDAKGLSRWFGEDGFAGIASGDQASYDRLKWATNQGGLLPEGIVDSFRQAISNPDTAQMALAFFGAAHVGDPSLLRKSGFTQDDITQVQLFSRLAQRRGNLDTAMTDYQAATDNQAKTGKTVDQLQTESVKVFEKAFPTTDSIVDRFDGWFTSAPNSTMNPATEGQLLSDASTAFQDGYLRYGTEEAATAYMETYLDQIWGVSQTKVPSGFMTWGEEGSKGVLMRHPPENYYTGSEGDLGFLYTAMSEYAVAGGAMPTGAVLVPDEITDREIREGKLPTYKVIGMDEFGGAITLEGRFGGQALQDGQDAFKTEDALQANATNRISDLRSSVAEIDSKIEFARGRGAEPGQVMALEREKAVLERSIAADTLAAVENGYLSPDLITDPVAQATFIQGKMALDPTVTQRVEQLVRNEFKGKEPMEARQLARAYIIRKDYKLTREAAAAVAASMLEQVK